jgi:hypothetical protein
LISLVLLGVLCAVGAETVIGSRRRVVMGYYSSGTEGPPIAYHKQSTVAAPVRIPSPLPGVSARNWEAFARRMRIATWDAVGHQQALGAFALKGPALVSVGLAVGAKKTKDGWAVVWKAGQSAAGFLSSKSLQYRAFALFCTRLCNEARVRFAPLLGVQTPYGPATVSGVVALLYTVGPAGARAWLTKPETRGRFPHTTAAFRRGNGVF